MADPARDALAEAQPLVAAGRYLLLLFEFHDDVDRAEIWRYGDAIGKATLDRHEGVKAVSIEGPGVRP